MCGIEDIHQEDITHTKNLIYNQMRKDKQEFYRRSLDIGAGIGRITFGCLYDICDEIDLVDINKNFLLHAKENSIRHKLGDKIRKIYPVPIQDFDYEYKYDLINIQWVLEYVSEANLKKFFSTTKQHLNRDAIVLVKENININNNNILLIEEEGSMIRPPSILEEIFLSSSLEVVHKEIYQFRSVSDLYEVGTWILKEKL